MIKLIQNILPFLIILYFLNKAFNKNGELIYLVFIPCFYYMGRSVFIENFGKLFSIGSIPVSYDDTLFLIVFFTWFILRNKRIDVRPIKINFDILILITLLIYFILHILYAFFSGESLISILGIALPAPYLPLSFFLWIGIFKRLSYQEIEKLFNLIKYFTAISMVMYILSALGFKIFPYEIESGDKFYSSYIIRDFSTFPNWAVIVLFYLFLQKTKKKIDIIILLTLLLGIFFTFTRSLIFSILAVFLVSFLMKSSLEKKSAILKQIILISLLTFALIYILNTYLLDYFDFFLGRAEEVSKAGIQKTGNFNIRTDLFLNIVDELGTERVLFGYGYFKMIVRGAMGNRILGDIIWAYLLFYYGIIGIINIAILYFSNLFISLRAYIRKRKENNYYFLCFLYILYLILVSFTSTGVITYPSMSLFMFALLSADIRGLIRNEYYD